MQSLRLHRQSLKPSALYSGTALLLAALWLALLPQAATAAARPRLPAVSAPAYALLSHNSGALITGRRPGEERFVGDLAKLMTAYVAFAELAGHEIPLEQKHVVSEAAWRARGARMFLEVDTSVTIGELLFGLGVTAGNDAAISLAEIAGGTVEIFVDLMNRSARRLQLASSHFVDVTGQDPAQSSSALDLALLASALIGDFPQFYHIFSVRSQEWNRIRQRNRNRLLFHETDVDGLMTTRSEKAGHSLVVSAERGGERFIAAVLGAGSDRGRFDDARKLLEYGFRFYRSRRLFEAGKELGRVRVWGSSGRHAAAGLAQDLLLSLQQQEFGQLQTELYFSEGLSAPLKKGAEVGQLRVRLPGRDQAVATEALVLLEDQPRARGLEGLLESLRAFFLRPEPREQRRSGSPPG